MKAKILKLSTVLGILFLFILNISCREVRIIDSSAEILSRTDTALNDSALIYGVVYLAKTTNMPVSDANIWIEETDTNTISNIQGRFSLKVLPGTYTINCLRDSDEERFTATLRNISLLSNEKVEVQFFHGYIAE